MKLKLISAALFILAFLLTAAVPLNAQDLQTTQGAVSDIQLTGEHIQSFNSAIQIHKDGTIAVKETVLYDFGDSERHGIYRTIPFIKVNDVGKKFKLQFDIQSVTDENGSSYNYVKSRTSDSISLKIGDANRTVSGIHTYIITYLVSGALDYFPDQDELFWNITGTDWTVPIATAVATIQLPIETGEVKTVCYTGSYGSKETNCSSSADKTPAIFATTRFLGIGEGLTAVVGFPKGLVAVLNPAEQINFFDTPFGKVVGLLLIIGGVLLVLWWYLIYPIKIAVIWWQRGRDPKGTVEEVTASYDGPKGFSGRSLSPAESGTVIDEQADFEDISASIVDLARRGYFKIEERKKGEFYFTLQKDWTSDTLLTHERDLLASFFTDGETEVRVKDLEFYSTIGNVKDDIYKQVVDEKLFDENPDKIRTFYTGMVVAGLMTINPLLFISALIFGRNLPRKTVAGVNAKNEALSLKNFLSSQERQLNFQAKNQMMFEKLLPFAVAFGVEKIWAQRFEKFKLKPPDWYQGYNSSSSFNSVIFMHSLNSSFSSVQSVSHPPSTSSSGFSTGGGFSGGGGGGGGGGSW